jgi:hypothetical protein
MSLSQDQIERLTLHTAFAVHQLVRWAAQSDLPNDVRERLRAHIEAIEGVLVTNGHDWIKDEMESTETALRAAAN